MRQHGRGSDAQLVIVTHRARDAALSRDRRALRTLPAVREVASVMRVEGDVMSVTIAWHGRDPWHGVIDRYRAWLPVTDSDSGDHAGRGRHAAGPGAGAVRASSAARSG